MKKFFVVVLLLGTLQVHGLSSVLGLATIGDLKSDETFDYPDYYRVKEDPRLQNINLLFLVHVSENFPKPSIPYKRDEQFGTWIKDTLDGTCMNTRGKVLVRDSDSNVDYNPNGCTVSRGKWNDPYTATAFISAGDIQIDHFIPLKNAYMTGAFEWDQSKRCLYANYMGNNFHLLSVSGKENMRKSDSTPDQYMPPNKNYACQYLKQWLEIKVIWKLRITPKEAAAIKTKVLSSHCDENDFLIPSEFVNSQRGYMGAHADLCHLL